MLIVPVAPEAVFEQLREGLTPLLEEELDVANASDSIEIAPPHRLYTTPLEDFVAGELLGMDRITSWQFIVLRDREPFGLAEVYVESGPLGEEVFEYGGFGLGSFSRSVIDAITVAETLPQVIARDYELRMLRVPAVYLYCVWLHGEAGDEILLPCDPAPPPLVPIQVTQPAAITTALHDFALYRLSVEDSDI